MLGLDFYGMPELPYRPAWNAVQAHLDGCPQCVTAFNAERIDLLCPSGTELNQALEDAYTHQRDLARRN